MNGDARWSRRQLLGTALGVGAGLWLAGRGSAFAAEPSGGLIALPRGREIGLVKPDGTEARTIVSLAPGGPTSPGGPPSPGSPGAPPTPKLLSGASGMDPSATRTVAAHDFPAEPFVAAPSGADARRPPQLPIDDAAVAWSPDGARMAVSGAPGVVLVNVADGETRRINENGSFGAIDWR